MSWDEDAEKCPDEGKWCDVCHDLCEGEESDCNAMEIRRMKKAIDKVKGIADEMMDMAIIQNNEPTSGTPSTNRAINRMMIRMTKASTR